MSSVPSMTGNEDRSSSYPAFGNENRSSLSSSNPSLVTAAAITTPAAPTPGRLDLLRPQLNTPGPLSSPSEPCVRGGEPTVMPDETNSHGGAYLPRPRRGPSSALDLNKNAHEIGGYIKAEPSPEEGLLTMASGGDAGRNDQGTAEGVTRVTKMEADGEETQTDEAHQGGTIRQLSQEDGSEPSPKEGMVSPQATELSAPTQDTDTSNDSAIKEERTSPQQEGSSAPTAPTCQLCGFTTSSMDSLVQHVRAEHEDITSIIGEDVAVVQLPVPAKPTESRMKRNKAYKCKQCLVESATKEQHWQHTQTHIRGDKILHCPKCEFVTEYKHHLQYHVRNHYGFKPFRCSKCSYSCVNKSMLNSHMKSHSDKFLFSCNDCNYHSKYCHSMKQHAEKYRHSYTVPQSLLGGSAGEGQGNTGASGPKPDEPSTATVNHTSTGRKGRGSRKIEAAVLASPTATSRPRPAGQSSGSNSMNNSTRMLSPTTPPHISQGMAPLPGANVTNPLVMQRSLWPFETSQPSSAMAVASMFNPVRPAGMPELFGQPSPWNQHASAISQQLYEAAANAMGGGEVHEAVPPPPSYTSNSGSATMSLANPLTSNPPKVAAGPMNFLNGIFGGAMAMEPNAPLQLSKSSAVSRMNQGIGGNEMSDAAGAVGANLFAPMAGMGRPPAPPPQQQQSVPMVPARGGLSPPSPPLQHTVRRGPSVMEKLESELPTSAPLDLTTVRPAMSSTSVTGVSAYDEGDAPGSRRRSRKGKAYRVDPSSVANVIDDDYSSYSGNISSKMAADLPPPSKMALSQATVWPSPTSKEGPALMTSVSEGVVSFTSTVRPPSETVAVIPATGTFRNDEASASKNAIGSVSSEPAESSSVSRGVVTSNGASEYECAYCDIRFRDCVMYTMHMGYHGYSDPFKCNMCGVNCENKLEFFLHIARTAHP